MKREPTAVTQNGNHRYTPSCRALHVPTSTWMTRRLTAENLLIVLVVASMVVGAGCGPPPRPGELLAAERLGRAAVQDDLKERTPDLWQAYKEYYQEAERYWRRKNLTESKEAARISAILYHTAEAEVRRARAEEGSDAMQDRIHQVRMDNDQARRRVAALSEEVARIRNNIRLTRDLEALQKRREQEQREAERKLARERMMMDARARYQKLVAHYREAEGYEAGRHAPQLMDVALRSLDEAVDGLEAGNLPAINAALDMAERALEGAVTRAREPHEAERTRQEMENSVNQLVAGGVSLQGVEVRREPRGVVFIMSDIFDLRGAAPAPGTIRTRGAAALDNLIPIIKAHPQFRITIEGHTDGRGKDEALEERTQSQAKAVKDKLAEGGVAKDRITTVGYGSRARVADDGTADGRTRNRRIEIVINTR